MFLVAVENTLTHSQGVTLIVQSTLHAHAHLLQHILLQLHHKNQILAQLLQQRLIIKELLQLLLIHLLANTV
jgi:hypothetical protein